MWLVLVTLMLSERGVITTLIAAKKRSKNFHVFYTFLYAYIQTAPRANIKSVLFGSAQRHKYKGFFTYAYSTVYRLGCFCVFFMIFLRPHRSWPPVTSILKAKF